MPLTVSSLLERARSLAASEELRRAPGWIGWLVVGALVVVAGMVRFHLSPVAIAEWDSWGWLHPALSWIGGAGFREEYEREWLYGAFIALGLGVTGSFAGYIVIQQALGLAAGVIMWLTWRRWVSLFPRGLALETGSTVVGVYLVALYLFNPVTMTLELSIRPEAIMAFVAFLQLFCVVSFCKFRWQERNVMACVIFGALSLPLAWAMYVLKPNWALAVPATVLPVFLGMFGKTPSTSLRYLPPAAGVALIVLTLWLPDKLLFIRTSQTRMVLPMTLFTIHADIIHKSLAGELQSPETAEERRTFLRGVLPLLDREIAAAKAEKLSYPRIGFDPDYLMYRSPLFPVLGSEFGLTPKEIAAFCRQSFVSAVLRQPADYARKVSAQMGHFFFPDDGTFFRKRVELAEVYTNSLKTVPAALDGPLSACTQVLYDEYLTDLKHEAATAGEIHAVRSLRKFLTGAKSLTSVIVALFLLALAACFAGKPLHVLRLPGLVALVIFSAPFGNALTVAMVHALDNSRYRGSYGPLLLFALGVFLLFSLVAAAYSAASLGRVRR